MTHFLRLLLLWQCKHVAHSRMVDKLSKGSNSSTFKNVSSDIGVTEMQDKATETRKTVIFTTTSPHTKKKKKKKKKTHTLSYHIWKRSSTLIRLKCIHGVYLPPKIDTLSEQSACHNMSNIHTAWSLFCQILPDQCTTVLTNQKAKTQKRD